MNLKELWKGKKIIPKKLKEDLGSPLRRTRAYKEQIDLRKGRGRQEQTGMGPSYKLRTEKARNMKRVMHAYDETT